MTEKTSVYKKTCPQKRSNHITTEKEEPRNNIKGICQATNITHLCQEGQKGKFTPLVAGERTINSISCKLLSYLLSQLWVVQFGRVPPSRKVECCNFGYKYKTFLNFLERSLTESNPKESNQLKKGLVTNTHKNILNLTTSPISGPL